MSGNRHRKTLPICNRFPTKRQYRSELEAMQQAARNDAAGRTDRYYHQCDTHDGCNLWHLTSQDPSKIGLYWDEATKTMRRRR